MARGRKPGTTKPKAAGGVSKSPAKKGGKRGRKPGSGKKGKKAAASRSPKQQKGAKVSDAQGSAEAGAGSPKSGESE